jgi:integrase/recombinase XerD
MATNTGWGLTVALLVLRSGNQHGRHPMRHQPPAPITATAAPTIEEMLRIWHADRCVQDNSAAVYLQWIRRFRAYTVAHELDERAELTLEGAHRFIAWYAQQRRLDPHRLGGARTALYALSRVYQVMEFNPLAWQSPQPAPPPASALLGAYADHLARQRGSPVATVHRRLDHIGRLLEYLSGHGKTWRTMALTDIDEFLVGCAQRYACSTVADIAGSVRSFTRFLLAMGRVSIDLADAIVAPVQPKFARPRRALPWEDVQRLLRSVDTSTACGLRDHAILLMMSTYGFGAGEVIRLQFQDIDWTASTLKIVRPKTGVAFTLPLLPAVAKALAFYLRDGRPPNTPTKHLFVCMKMPFSPLSASSAVRHIIVKHAKVAGLTASYLGSHVLRHSNAARQVDLGIRPRVLSDLLGHRDPESISTYVRIATETLRDVSLPVPT